MQSRRHFEVLLLHRRDVLIAEEQHFVLQPQSPDFGNGIRIEGGIRQADVAEFGADGGPTLIDAGAPMVGQWPVPSAWLVK